MTVLAFDFDGVILDTQAIKAAMALKMFGVEVDGKLLESEIVKVGLTPLSLDQYRQLQAAVFSNNPEVLAQMRFIKGAREMLEVLSDEGYTLPIVTARLDDALVAAQWFMSEVSHPDPVVGVGYMKDKSETLNELGAKAYVDDDLAGILRLSGFKGKVIHFCSDCEASHPEGVLCVSSIERLLPVLF